MKNNKGFSLIEIVVVLAIMGVIAAFLTPMLFDYMKDSKLRRAQSDAQSIAACITRFNTDTGVFPIYTALPAQNANANVLVLVTDGNDAALGGSAGTWNYTWTTASSGGSYLENHLHKGVISDGTTLYNNSTNGVKKPNEWKGPYLTDFKADPWGNRYYISTAGMKPGVSKAAFVLSAGPNGIIDTAVSQEAGSSTTPFAVGDDDIAYRIK